MVVYLKHQAGIAFGQGKKTTYIVSTVSCLKYTNLVKSS